MYFLFYVSREGNTNVINISNLETRDKRTRYSVRLLELLN